MSEMPTVNESCSCGATFAYTGISASSVASRWREDHGVCRRSAAAALSAGCQHVPLTEMPGEGVPSFWCEQYGKFYWQDDVHGETTCPGPHLPLWVEAEQTKQENPDG